VLAARCCTSTRFAIAATPRPWSSPPANLSPARCRCSDTARRSSARMRSSSGPRSGRLVGRSTSPSGHRPRKSSHRPLVLPPAWRQQVRRASEPLLCARYRKDVGPEDHAAVAHPADQGQVPESGWLALGFFLLLHQTLVFLAISGGVRRTDRCCA
jgi:hypothetical protein